MIRATDLSWRAGGKAILHGTSLTVAKGEVLGLIGPNGSGKSTLLRLLAGLLKPSSGHLELAGRPLDRMRQRDIARLLAFVAQQAETSDRISVRDAVELGRTPWLDALRPWSEEDDRHVAHALARVGMQGFETRDWITLSGGERQRVHIARALAQCPKVMLLDEPTNHLDIHHQLSIMQLVLDLKLTTVIALHDLNQAMICDRLGVMHHGRLIAFGPPAGILTPELLERVFAVRVTELTDPSDGSRIMRFLPLNRKETICAF
ncbi:ABC transporter ATP-binding protein [Paracoccus onubensis]|uniref:ABC transporter ATP-binding protein n=1 Tax=Paracoccus onubensis TaxID=1675788 RepID=UPI0027320986|nr:ABC transporter ATP-binding protein [Paracoccus onubensis]MDP0926876.1 ABC transporter ATP-binding protein [Paracoccus onubensis]